MSYSFLLYKMESVLISEAGHKIEWDNVFKRSWHIHSVTQVCLTCEIDITKSTNTIAKLAQTEDALSEEEKA